MAAVGVWAPLEPGSSFDRRIFRNYGSKANVTGSHVSSFRQGDSVHNVLNLA